MSLQTTLADGVPLAYGQQILKKKDCIQNGRAEFRATINLSKEERLKVILVHPLSPCVTFELP
jgi:hypothetical protein